MQLDFSILSLYHNVAAFKSADFIKEMSLDSHSIFYRIHILVPLKYIFIRSYITNYVSLL